MTLTFKLTVPTGGSADATAKMVKYASIDFVGPGKGCNGYDTVTRLGSNLSSTAQTASIGNMGHGELADQNSGCDLVNGIPEV